MDTTATNRRLRVLLTAISNGNLIPQPEFQRRLVWSNNDKIEFIKTVLSDFPFPEIYIAAGKVDAKTGEGTEMLVDGQQRITTLYQYFKDSPDIKLPKGFKKYQELSEEEQIKFLEYKVVVRDLGNLSIAQIKTIFQRINSTSYGLNAMEIHNSRYDGEFKKFGEQFAGKDFFEKYRVFSTNDVRRMNDVLYCLGIVSTLLSTYFNRDSDIEEFLDKYNEAFPDKNTIESIIDKTLNAIEKMNFSQDSRAFKKGDFFTLFIEIYRYISSNKKVLDIVKARSALDELYEDVEFVAKGNQEKVRNADAIIYYKASLQAVNDRNSRIDRGNIINKILSEI